MRARDGRRLLGFHELVYLCLAGKSDKDLQYRDLTFYGRSKMHPECAQVTSSVVQSKHTRNVTKKPRNKNAYILTYY
jgi:hypothetical protein